LSKGPNEYISAKRLHKTLIKHYNLQELLPKEREVFLPFCKETVSLTCHDARAQTIDLLTDPRLTDDSYLFFDDDPFLAGLPPEMDTIGEINTGLVYRVTYEKLIAPEPYTRKGRRKVLLPYIFYLDGTVVGRMNQNLSLEIMKITLGILRGKICTKQWAWRNLGHMKKLVQARRQAKANIRESGHIDADQILPAKNYRAKNTQEYERRVPGFDPTLYMEDSGPRKRKRQPVVLALCAEQDSHTMLHVLLASYKKIKDQGGIEWDHRQNNKSMSFCMYHSSFSARWMEGRRQVVRTVCQPK
jgi:hypothetical protein